MSKIDDSLFDKRSAAEQSYGECPKCSADLHLKYKGKSTFLGCSNYPACEYSESVHHDEVKILKVIGDSQCPQCSSLLAVKNGRFGMFIGCTNFPDCHYIQHQSAPPKDDEAVISCPQCEQGTLQKKQNKYGKFFYACDQYPSCKFLINQKPIQQSCKACGYTVAIEVDGGKRLICANKKCGKPISDSEVEK